MPKIRWDVDHSTDTHTGYHVDHANGKLTRVTVQDPSALIKKNKFRRAHDNTAQRRRTGQMFEIADVPNAIYLLWKEKHGCDMLNKDDFRKMMSLIHSQDYAPSVKVTDGNYMQGGTRQHFVGARDRASHPLASNRAQSQGATGGLVDTGAWRL